MGDSICFRRGKEVELRDHIFKTCDWMKGVWFTCRLGIDVYCLALMSFMEWMAYTKDQLDEDDWGYFWMVAWMIWRA